jgi:hypothetical protein
MVHFRFFSLQQLDSLGYVLPEALGIEASINHEPAYELAGSRRGMKRGMPPDICTRPLEHRRDNSYQLETGGWERLGIKTSSRKLRDLD